MEKDLEEKAKVEQIFQRTLLQLPNVSLWSMYIDYIRRRHNLATDTDGKARAIITQAFDLCLAQIGLDKDAGFLWQDYINFAKSAPGHVGGSGWQDQQKMDSLRKIYRQAICVPTQTVNAIWQEYSRFENELNKQTVSR
jgi:cleavage stimulation factor subunit 3